MKLPSMSEHLWKRNALFWLWDKTVCIERICMATSKIGNQTMRFDEDIVLEKN